MKSHFMVVPLVFKVTYVHILMRNIVYLTCCFTESVIYITLDLTCCSSD